MAIELRFLRQLATKCSRPRWIVAFIFSFLLLTFYQFLPSILPTGLSPYQQLNETSFGQRGLLAQALYQQLRQAEGSPLQMTQRKHKAAEKLAKHLFPFIQSPDGSSRDDDTPLWSLRSTFSLHSKGIVIPAGKKNLVFARQSILALRDVLNVTLPIAVAYAGDEDLSPDQQNSLLGLRPNVEMLDVLTVLSDEYMNLGSGSWSVKPFAALASRFEQVILIDADIVFVQSPEILFDDLGFQETGALFFYDRQFEREPGNRRQRFLEQETKDIDLLESCCQNILKNGYTEEQDSGVVVLDKRRLQVLIGLMHTCWQNSSPVRDKVTYDIFYGDKETFWMGMALTQTPYTFYKNSAGIVGELREREGKMHICGNTISHYSDADHRLIWYNGSLLRNKYISLYIYMVPQYQILGGQCHWMGNAEGDLKRCCSDAEILALTDSERSVLEKSVEIAKNLDGHK
ncbi:mannosyltransferase putative-domain-containing protein [Talaromyces proteolyticus]|uniref:Mannosyltransferase putative-domain-containing protein n=1 Tax=Talaromyces proteolyticus TaxID=1131652 RepID=A0AAD4KP99_9EURO|nr:mannosyltransferase putative-domain-containing protein [Talaromyces proteolyticus]KAH8696063.1 mannosyltransferase putative-domain-containing protein [Talaromyces proteolyticus]